MQLLINIFSTITTNLVQIINNNMLTTSTSSKQVQIIINPNTNPTNQNLDHYIIQINDQGEEINLLNMSAYDRFYYDCPV